MCRIELANMAALAIIMLNHEKHVDTLKVFKDNLDEKKRLGTVYAVTSVADSSGNPGPERIRTPCNEMTLEEYGTLLENRVAASTKALTDAGVHIEYPPTAVPCGDAPVTPPKRAGGMGR